MSNRMTPARRGRRWKATLAGPAALLAVVAPSALAGEVTAVTSPTSGSVALAAGTTVIGGASVSVDTPSEIIQVAVSTDIGTLSITSNSGLTLAYGDAWSGRKSISFTGTAANINPALATLALTPGNRAGEQATVKIAAIRADSRVVYSPTNGHFYEYVSSSGVTWGNALTAAATRTYAGQTGYLASVPTSDVNDIIANRLGSGVESVWIGARATNYPGSTVKRVWSWAAGPYTNTVISNCTNLTGICNFSPATTVFSAWSSGEPNNAGDGESYAVTNWNATFGLWNDLPNSATGVQGYIAEYGNNVNGSSPDFIGMRRASAAVDVQGVPGAPTAVTAQRGDGSATVTFTAPANNGGAVISGYTVSSSPGGLSCVAATTAGCTVTGLTRGLAYTFTAKATNVHGTGAASASSSAITAANVPGAPTLSSVSHGHQQLQLTVAAPADNGGEAVTGYQYTLNGGTTWSTLTTSGSGPFTATVGGLDDGTEYTVKVRARNVLGAGVASTPAAETPSTVPGAPTGVTAARGHRTATVAWSAPADDGGDAIGGYTATASPGGATCTAAGTGDECAIAGLSNGQQYTVTVVAENRNGQGPASATASVTPATVPGAPTVGTAVSGDGTITFPLAAPADNGGDAVGGYQYTVNNGDTWSTLTVTAGHAQISGLANGTAYTVLTRARNDVGAGAASTPITATPAAAPGTPRDVAVDVTATTATVRWSPPQSDNGAPITRYTVTAAPDGGTCATDGAGRSCTISGLAAGRAYTFTVAADNGHEGRTATGTGAATAAGGTTESTAGAPMSLTVTPGDRVLYLAFTRPAESGIGAITGYQVSTDGGATWATLAVTGDAELRGRVAGVRNGATFDVAVRAVGDAGPGRAVHASAATARWFTDPRTKATRSRLRKVPRRPAAYTGKRRLTVALDRSRTGTVAIPAGRLKGRQLQDAQAFVLSGPGMFRRSTARLSPRGARAVRAAAASLAHTRTIACEGYVDYRFPAARGKALARKRAATVCRALVAAGARVTFRARGYGATRPVLIGGKASRRAVNWRVVVVVRG